MDNTVNRKTLRNYFADGSLPTEANFAALVDSTLNIEDDRFSRSAENGVEIKVLAENKRLLSLFGDAKARIPDWSISFGGKDKDGEGDTDKNTLHFVTTGGPDNADGAANGSQARNESKVLTLSAKGYVGIGALTPGCELDVAGKVRSTGRTGTIKSVPADGELHDISGPLEGCQAFEVIAGVGTGPVQKKGRYALIHAIALNTFNPTGFFFNFLKYKNRIKAQQAFYLYREDRLKLEWFRLDDDRKDQYRLGLKTSSDYIAKFGLPIRIKCSITKLWFDPFMDQTGV